MNKQLIRKYEKEFVHWINGGNVQAFYKKDDEPKWLTDKECIEHDGYDNFSHIINYSLGLDDVLIVINDEYVEFRKALAEGKTIQYYVDGFVGWQDVTNLNQPSTHPNDFRIKPEPFKFKVGDWVIHNGVIKQVTKVVDGLIDSLDYHVAVIMKEESLERWKPKEEEYFWFMNDLVKFHDTQTNAGILLHSARGCSYYPNEKSFEGLCEPFIGELPSNLKQVELNKNEKE